jgi:hypothetical protein
LAATGVDVSEIIAERGPPAISRIEQLSADQLKRSLIPGLPDDITENRGRRAHGHKRSADLIGADIDGLAMLDWLDSNQLLFFKRKM